MKPPHVDAADELERAARWYEREHVGLGDELVDALSAAFDTIRESPRAWAPTDAKGRRRYLLARFPYAIVYAETETEIRVLAVAHVKREPGHSRGR